MSYFKLTSKAEDLASTVHVHILPSAFINPQRVQRHFWAVEPSGSCTSVVCPSSHGCRTPSYCTIGCQSSDSCSLSPPTTGGMLPQAVRSQTHLPQLSFGSLMGQVDSPKPMLSCKYGPSRYAQRSNANTQAMPCHLTRQVVTQKWYGQVCSGVTSLNVAPERAQQEHTGAA